MRFFCTKIVYLELYSLNRCVAGNYISIGLLIAHALLLFVYFYPRYIFLCSLSLSFKLQRFFSLFPIIPSFFCTQLALSLGLYLFICQRSVPSFFPFFLSYLSFLSPPPSRLFFLLSLYLQHLSNFFLLLFLLSYFSLVFLFSHLLCFFQSSFSPILFFFR